MFGRIPEINPTQIAQQLNSTDARRQATRFDRAARPDGSRRWNIPFGDLRVVAHRVFVAAAPIAASPGAIAVKL
jgi:hypothetical protein